MNGTTIPQKIQQIKANGAINLLLSIVALLIPFAQKFVPLGIALSVLTVIIVAIIHRDRFKNNRPKLIAQDLLVILFILYLIGMSYSVNMSFARMDIEAKLSFVVFPIIFFFIRWMKIKIAIQQIGLFFIIGCIVSTIIAITNGIDCFLEKNSWTCFVSSSLTGNMHVNYLSIYYGTGILLLWHQSFSKWLKLLLSAWFAVFIVSFLSIGAYLALFIGGFALFLWKRKQANLSKIQYTALFFGAVIALSGLILKFGKNYDQMYKGIDSKEELYERANYYSESILTRLVVWNVALGEIKEAPLGVGTGDVKDALIAEYKKQELTKMERQRLNPHNQFLQTGVSIGFQGILALLLLIIFTIRRSLKTDNIPLFTFVFILFFNMLFESFLEVQAGIVFSAFILFVFEGFSNEFSDNKSQVTT